MRKKAKPWGKLIQASHLLDDDAHCEICGCAGRTLLTYCPGFKLSRSAEKAISMGRVKDLPYLRMIRNIRRRRDSHQFEGN